MTFHQNILLSEWSTLGVGGPARWFCQPTNADEVCEALTWARARRVPSHVLGGGSNVVFADEGFDGLVLAVTIRGATHTPRGDRILAAVGAGEPWDPFVAATVSRGCAGLECLSGIPGQVGGTPVQNVGAYGQHVATTITSVHVVDRSTHEQVTLSNEACRFGYRTSRFKTEDVDRFVVTAVEFALHPGGPPTLSYADVIAHFAEQGEPAPSLEAVRRAILQIRRRKGMVIEEGNPANRSVGSFFVNPVVDVDHFRRLDRIAAGALPSYPVDSSRVKVPAAWLIEHAGFARGLARGSVGVSPLQAQAIINLGGAKAADVVALAAEIKAAVWKRYEIALVPEPVFVGFRSSPDVQWLLDRRSYP